MQWMESAMIYVHIQYSRCKTHFTPLIFEPFANEWRGGYVENFIRPNYAEARVR